MAQTLDEIQAEHEAEAAVFYAELGRAIAGWSSVELSLCRVFEHALGTPSSAPARSAFFANHAFSSKFEMTQHAFLVTYAKTPLAPHWDRVGEKLRVKAKVRNNLAHAPVVLAAQQPKGRRVYMDVGIFNPASHPSVTGRQRTKYFAHDLQQVRDAFRKVGSELGILEYRIERFLEGKPID
jgi:hypothetical protein